MTTEQQRYTYAPAVREVFTYADEGYIDRLKARLEQMKALACVMRSEDIRALPNETQDGLLWLAEDLANEIAELVKLSTGDGAA